MGIQGNLPFTLWGCLPKSVLRRAPYFPTQSEQDYAAFIYPVFFSDTSYCTHPHDHASDAKAMLAAHLSIPFESPHYSKDISNAHTSLNSPSSRVASDLPPNSTGSQLIVRKP
jgi:hypothetical protein